MLRLLSGQFAVCQLPPESAVPPWATEADFFSLTRTQEELSVLCPVTKVPEGVRCEKGWRCLRVRGKFDFSAVGILASLAAPLAQAGISVFVTSTFDTDYLLVKEDTLSAACATLHAAGHTVEENENTFDG